MTNSEFYHLPRADEAEMSLLSAIMVEPSVVSAVVETLKPEDFFSPSNGLVYDAILYLFEKGEPTDYATIVNALQSTGKLEKAGGSAYISQVFEHLGLPSACPHYAKIIKDKAVLRRIIMVCMEVSAQASEDTDDVEKLLDMAEAKMLSIRQFSRKYDFLHINQTLGPTWEELEKRVGKPSSVTGIPTGFKELDNITSGFHAGDFVLIAGRPGFGKTSLAMDIARHVAVKENKPVAFFSLEMTNSQLTQRLLASSAKVNAHLMRQGRLAEADWRGMARHVGPIESAPLYILDTPGLDMIEIRAKARREKAEHDTQLIIIDYLGLIRPPRGRPSREQEISMISQSLKALAKELEVPVIALSQLSRAVEQRGGEHRPRLSDLRDSGALEQDADIVMFVYRAEKYEHDKPELEGRAEIIIAKHRNGPVGIVDLNFNGASMTFEELKGY